MPNRTPHRNLTVLEMLTAHIEEEHTCFETLEQEIKSIKENHLAHIQGEIEKINTTLASVKSDVSWLKWLTLATLGAGIANVVNLLFRN